MSWERSIRRTSVSSLHAATAHDTAVVVRSSLLVGGPGPAEPLHGAPGHLRGGQRPQRVGVALAVAAVVREDLDVVPAAVAGRLQGGDEPREVDHALAGQEAVAPRPWLRRAPVDLHRADPPDVRRELLADPREVPEVPRVE